MKLTNFFKKSKEEKSVEAVVLPPVLQKPFKEVLAQFKKDNKEMISNLKGYRSAWKKFHETTPAIEWCWKSDPNYENYLAYKDALNKVLEPFDVKADRRHVHLAYSLLKGRKYKQIENKVRKDNLPNIYMIEHELKKYIPNCSVKWSEDEEDIILEGIEK